MSAFFTASDGARIAFRRTGEGPALLCLAGLTRNGSDFGYVRPYLTGVQVILMDYRGRGASAWSGHPTYTIPREAQDVLELLDHLGLGRTAILGTSRGGLIAMTLAMVAKERLTGVALNDIGPELTQEGLETIRGYVGTNPVARTFQEAEAIRASLNPGFFNVPASRWAEEVRLHYVETPDGLKINYDPALAIAVAAAFDAPPVDLWPFFDALAGLPLAGLRGANSNLLSPDTFAEMRRRRPDMIAAEVPDRGHVPFLDEPASLAVIERFLDAIR